MKTYAILLAGGVGKRVKSGVPKQFLKVFGKMVLEHSVEVFENNELIDEIIVVTHKRFLDFTNEIFKRNRYKKIANILVGGKTRQKSSYIGVCSVCDDEAKILIHDAVRPLVTDRMIRDCIVALDTYDAVSVAIPETNTIVKSFNGSVVDGILERQLLVRVQTPQAFKLSVIRYAHELANAQASSSHTDDCGIVKLFNLARIHIVKGDETNIKITNFVDIFIADMLFKMRHSQPPATDLEGLVGKF
ncbi:MAG: 2-C-methyl-D-erythritol 4-phosphate cytidylyltransferase [Puniceicoccales bacterium]|nr:2-C-methyl-D-erythritol 4-phosphate cytidylyltransferase [Puniceicoccales bacterium]